MMLVVFDMFEEIHGLDIFLCFILAHCILISICLLFTDSKGYLVDEEGFDFVKISFLREIKAQNRSLRYICSLPLSCNFLLLQLTTYSCRDYSKTYARSKFYDEAKPWNERCDVGFTCASQNEIDQSDAIQLVNSGCHLLVEGRAWLCTFGFCYPWGKICQCRCVTVSPV